MPLNVINKRMRELISVIFAIIANFTAYLGAVAALGAIIFLKGATNVGLAFIALICFIILGIKAIKYSDYMYYTDVSFINFINSENVSTSTKLSPQTTFIIRLISYLLIFGYCIFYTAVNFKFMCLFDLYTFFWFFPYL